MSVEESLSIFNDPATSSSDEDEELLRRHISFGARKAAAQRQFNAARKLAKAEHAAPESCSEEHPLSAANPANQVCYAALKGDLPRLQRLVERHGAGIVWKRSDFRTPVEPPEPEPVVEDQGEDEALVAEALVAEEGQAEDAAMGGETGSETKAPALDSNAEPETSSPEALTDDVCCVSVDSMEASTATPDDSAPNSVSADSVAEQEEASTETPDAEDATVEVDPEAAAESGAKEDSKESMLSVKERRALQQQRFRERQAEAQREKEAAALAALEAARAAAALKRAEEKLRREKALKAQVAAEAQRRAEAAEREQRNAAKREQARFTNYAQLLEGTAYLGALPLEVAVRHHGSAQGARNASDKRDLRDVIDYLLEVEPELGGATAQAGEGAVARGAMADADCARLDVRPGTSAFDLLQNRWVPPLLWAARYENTAELCLQLVTAAKEDINKPWREGTGEGGERVGDSFATEPEELYKLLAHGFLWNLLPVAATATGGGGGADGALARLAAHGQNIHTDLMERAARNMVLEALRVTQASAVPASSTKWLRFLGPSARDRDGGGAAAAVLSRSTSKPHGASAWAATAGVLQYLHVQRELPAARAAVDAACRRRQELPGWEKDWKSVMDEEEYLALRDSLAERRCAQLEQQLTLAKARCLGSGDERQLRFLALPEPTLDNFAAQFGELAKLVRAGGEDCITLSDARGPRSEAEKAESSAALAAFRSLISSAFSDAGFLGEELYSLLIPSLQQRVREGASKEGFMTRFSDRVNKELLGSTLASLQRVWELRLSRGPGDLKDGERTLRLVLQRLLTLFLQDEYLLVRDRPAGGEPEVLFATAQRESVEFMARLLNNDVAQLRGPAPVSRIYGGSAAASVAKAAAAPAAEPLPPKEHLEFNFARKFAQNKETFLARNAAPFSPSKRSPLKRRVIAGNARRDPDASEPEDPNTCTAFEWVSAALSVGKAALKLSKPHPSQLPKIDPTSAFNPAPARASSFLKIQACPGQSFLKIQAEFDLAVKAKWTATALEFLCKKLKRKLEADSALWAAVKAYAPFTGTCVDVDAVLAQRAEGLESLKGRARATSAGAKRADEETASAVAPAAPDAAEQAPEASGELSGAPGKMPEQASPPPAPKQPVVRNNVGVRVTKPVEGKKVSSEFYVAKRVKNAGSFDFRADVLAPIVAALLHAQNEYGWNCASCPPGTQIIVLQVLAGRCESVDDMDGSDFLDEAAKKTQREKVDAAVLRDLGAMLLGHDYPGATGEKSIPQLLTERLPGDVLSKLQKFLNEQEAGALDALLLKQVLSESKAEKSAEASAAPKKRPESAKSAAQKVRTATEILNAGKSRSAVRRALKEYRARILGPQRTWTANLPGDDDDEDDDRSDNGNDEEEVDDEILMMTPEELRNEAIHLLSNSIFADCGRFSRSADRNPFCLPLAPETRKQKRRNLKAILNDIYMANGEFAENQLRGEFFKAVWDRLRMNWYGGRGSRALLLQAGEIADVFTQAVKSDLDFYETIIEKRKQ